MNSRKNKQLFSLWLTQEEAKILFEQFKTNNAVYIASILRRAIKRGDFEKR